MNLLLALRTRRFIGPVIKQFLSLYGLEIPPTVRIGDALALHHRGQGVIIHEKVQIGNRVSIWQQVTVGRAGIDVQEAESDFEGIVVSDDVILCAGSKVLGKRGVLTVGAGTIVAANAVLLCSTGEYEVWGGVPARLLGHRKRPHE